MSAIQTLSTWVSVHFSSIGARLFRNSTGMAWQGKSENVRVAGRPAVLIKDPVFLPFGLIVKTDTRTKSKKKSTGGGADKIGWLPMVITADMVGQAVALFLAVEEKTEHDRLSPDQRNFLDQVDQAGGMAFVAKETADGPKLVRWKKE